MKRFILIFALVFTLSGLTAQAQTTAFNFQGRLNDGSSPANGRYDLQFKLYDQIAGGTQVGLTVDRPNLMLINGVFSTTLDFGGSAFDGNARFIEISLRPTSPANIAPNAYTILGARQQILSVPYAVKSLNSSNADNAANAANADNATNATNAVNSQQLGGVAASQYIQQGSFLPVKAMVFVNPYLSSSQKIVRCYNSQLGGAAATTVPCGFTALPYTADGTTIGHWEVNFNFDTTNSFFSLTTVTTTGNSGRRMTVSSLAGGFNGVGGQIDNCSSSKCVFVVTKYTDDQNFTNDPFFVVVY